MPHILSVTVIMPQLMAKKQIVFFLLATLMVDFTIKVIKLLDNNMNLIRKKSLISQLDYCFGCVNLAVMLWFLVSYIERNVIFKGMFGLLMLSRKEKKRRKRLRLLSIYCNFINIKSLNLRTW
jgi:ammonia channel protein AmtB